MALERGKRTIQVETEENVTANKQRRCTKWTQKKLANKHIQNETHIHIHTRNTSDFPRSICSGRCFSLNKYIESVSRWVV